MCPNSLKMKKVEIKFFAWFRSVNLLRLNAALAVVVGLPFEKGIIESVSALFYSLRSPIYVHFHAKCLTFAIYILRNNTLEAYTYTYTAVDWCAAAKKKPQWNHSNVWFFRKWYHHANKNALNSIWFGWIKFAIVLRLNI